MAAAILIGVATAASAVSNWTSWHAYQVVRDYLAGDPSVTDDDLDDADRLLSGVGWGFIVFLLAAGAVFLVWLWRARQNAEILCHAPHRRGRGWVIGSWFCPIVNWWFPFMVVDDIYRASRPDTPRDADLRAVPGSPLLGYWWAALVASWFVDQIVARMWRDDLTVDSLRTVAILETVGVALMVGAAVLIIAIMRRISDWQHQAADERLIATG